MKTTTLTANKRGFTLVEILMVLLILAILSGGIVFLSSDNSSSITANKIISEIRTMKAASIMYRRDHGMITAGTPVSSLKPYIGSSIENSEVSYSFVFDENGQVFLQADLCELDDIIRQKIADLADQNLYLKPGEESASLPEESSFFAQFNPKNALGYFTATPAYAENSRGQENRKGWKSNANSKRWWDDLDDFLEDLIGDDEDNEDDYDDSNDEDDDEDDFDDTDDNDDEDYEDDLDNDEYDDDDVDDEDDEDVENETEEGEYQTPDFSGGNNGGNSEESGSQENSGSSSGSVSSEGEYSGGDKLLIRI